MVRAFETRSGCDREISFTALHHALTVCILDFLRREFIFVWEIVWLSTKNEGVGLMERERAGASKAIIGHPSSVLALACPVRQSGNCSTGHHRGVSYGDDWRHIKTVLSSV